MTDLLGIHETELSRLENRRKHPSPQALARLCAYFQKDESYWYEPDTPDQERASEPIDARSLGTFSSDGLNHLPHRWIRTNLSNSELVWNDVKDDPVEWAMVADLVRSYYGKKATKITSPQHVEASNVYGITEQDHDSPSLFLKIFKDNRSVESIEDLLSIHEIILDSPVFLEQAVKCLHPVTPLDNKSQWVRTQDGRPAILFPFLKGAENNGRVTHFTGKSKRELINAGRKLGEINNLLNDSKISTIRSRSVFHWNPDLWDQVIESIDLTKDDPLVSRRQYILRAEARDIKRVRTEIQYLEPIGALPITYHDFHPHNIFVSDDECVLVIDWDGPRRDWPEEGTVLFALLCFCRGYVRHFFVNSAQPDEMMLVRDSASAFLKGYTDKRHLDIGPTSILWAKAINFAKLMNNFAYGNTYRFRTIRDVGGRTEEQHYREVIKFVSYLKEFDKFELALSEL